MFFIFCCFLLYIGCQDCPYNSVCVPTKSGTGEYYDTLQDAVAAIGTNTSVKKIYIMDSTIITTTELIDFNTNARSGTLGDPLELLPYPGVSATIRRDLPNTDLFDLRNIDYWNIHGNVANGGSLTFSLTATANNGWFFLLGNSKNINFYDLTISFNTNRDIPIFYTEPGCENIVIDNIEATNTNVNNGLYAVLLHNTAESTTVASGYRVIIRNSKFTEMMGLVRSVTGDILFENNYCVLKDQNSNNFLEFVSSDDTYGVTQVHVFNNVFVRPDTDTSTNSAFLHLGKVAASNAIIEDVQFQHNLLMYAGDVATQYLLHYSNNDDLNTHLQNSVFSNNMFSCKSGTTSPEIWSMTPNIATYSCGATCDFSYNYFDFTPTYWENGTPNGNWVTGNDNTVTEFDFYDIGDIPYPNYWPMLNYSGNVFSGSPTLDMIGTTRAYPSAGPFENYECSGNFINPPLCQDCADGYWGDICNDTCSTCTSCDKATGQDCADCLAGYYSLTTGCDGVCSVGCETPGQCNVTDGACYPCQNGYYEITCQSQCDGCKTSCDLWGNNCDECIAGRYGVVSGCVTDCPTTCSGGNNDCDDSGACTIGCDDGRYAMATGCDQPCPTECGGLKSCTDNGTVCLEGCVAGQREADCQVTCGNCLNTCSQFGTDCDACKDTWTDRDTNLCETACNPTCNNTMCDEVTGACTDGCVTGFMDSSTGCVTSCPSNCEVGTDCSDNGDTCLEGCKNGWRTANCSQSCPNCVTSCNQYTLECDACEATWTDKTGNLCETPCSLKCVDQLCDEDTAECTSGCIDGWYDTAGECLQECPENCGGTKVCNEDGNCTAGCVDTFRGPTCNDTCPNCANSCDQYDLTCDACKPGFYGRLVDLCGTECPVNCLNNACDQDTGACTDGCDPGWRDKAGGCNVACEVECLGAQSECLEDGECKLGCEDGYYNKTAMCQLLCPNECADPKDCNDDGTTCLSGCIAGYRGADCQETCPNCNYTCGQYTQDCDACVDGYTERGTNLCLTKCADNCAGTYDDCDEDSGVCTIGCDEGFYDLAAECATACPVNCLGTVNNCSDVDGACLIGCEDGYRSMASKCNTQCPPECGGTKACTDAGDECLDGCIAGRQGIVCEVTCPNCLTTCDQNGTACDACITGYTDRLTNLCLTPCGIHCNNSVCHEDTGACTDGCTAGWYDEANGCVEECPVNCDGPNNDCDDSGVCTLGCDDGKRGDYCDVECPNCLTYCDRYTQECDACKSGWMDRLGNLCNTSCPENCFSNACHEDSGACTSGCNPGFYDSDSSCVTPCPTECSGVDNDCDNSGACTIGCDAGFYSKETGCNETCPNNCGGPKDCNNEGTNCLSGCVDGFRGDICDEPCIHCNNSCDQFGMGCDACVSGWTDRDTNLCDTPCGSNCVNDVCEEIGGACIDGCEEGFHTMSGGCVATCPTFCDPTNRTCTDDGLICLSGCEDGYREDDCSVTCDNCANSCHQYNMECDSCVPGFTDRGTNMCLTPCGDNCVNATCHEDTGACLLGCERGFYNMAGGCVDPCVPECGGTDGPCNDAGTICTEGCIAKKHGDLCQDSCDNCVTDCAQDGSSCDDCIPGFWGRDANLCTSVCNANCSGVNDDCDAVNGQCTLGCDIPFYGMEVMCQLECPPQCGGSGACDNAGACTSSCNSHFWGVSCDKTCNNCENSCTPDGAECDSCIDGFYGRLDNLCTSSCPTNCVNDNCHEDTAACLDGCEAGFYDMATGCNTTCHEECGGDGACDDTNTNCLNGCDDGNYGLDCQSSCPNCLTSCARDGSECDSCIEGKWGRNTTLCGTACPLQCAGDKCDQHTGACYLGCKPGYWDSLNGCIEGCPTDCSGTNNDCDDFGACTIGCDLGYYQMSTGCSENCNVGCGGNGTCEDNGECSFACDDGYYDLDCSQTCPNCDPACTQDGAECLACEHGWYGRLVNLCTTECSTNCVNKTCHEDTGACLEGCVPGTYDSANQCNETCSPMCDGLDNDCDDSGVCTLGCDVGYYDVATGCSLLCEEECGGDGSCDDVGICSNGCDSGYQGDYCQGACPNCVSSCTRYDTECNACIIGWTDRVTNLCETPCPVNCAGSNNECDDDTGGCELGCDDGFYSMATGCNETCPDHCGGDKSCTDDGGLCLDGCEDYYWGSDCSLTCNNCVSNCTQGGTECDACIPEFYGRLTSLCTSPCPFNCQDQLCDQDSSVCTTGCVPGTYDTLAKCSKNCSDTCGGAGDCTDDDTGECLEDCVTGYYGKAVQCSLLCEVECGGDGGCDDTGVCTSGCDDGFRGDFCQVTCPLCLTSCDQYATTCDACINGTFDKNNLCQGVCPDNCLGDGEMCYDNGDCTACDIPYMDADCSTLCDTRCGGDGSCDQVTGECLQNCDIGWYDTASGCNLQCESECGGDGSCHVVSGDCLQGCDNGKQGPKCQVDCAKCKTSCSQFGTDCNACIVGYTDRATNLCETPCPINCAGANNECHEETGACTIGCDVPYFNMSSQCDQLCPIECGGDGSCSNDGDLCLMGCDNHFYGSDCQLTCNDCLTNCQQDGSSCDACPFGKWGLDTTLCTTPCSSTCAFGECDEVNGACTSGCVDGFYNKAGGCNMNCSDTCRGAANKCFDNGACFLGCDDGFYDMMNGCDDVCPSTCAGTDNPCDDIGRCSAGCDQYYYGEYCESSCNNCLTMCNILGTACDDCIPGFYGRVGQDVLCTIPCPTNCLGPNNDCHRDTGVCTIGCDPGWYSKATQCDQKCPDTCAGEFNECDDTGDCIYGCDSGYYSMGTGCDQSCPVNCGGTRNCTDSGDECLEGCLDGHYGLTCNNDCPNCLTGCTQDGGECDACDPGYWGRTTALCNNDCPVKCGGVNNDCDEDSGVCTVGCDVKFYSKATGCDQDCPTNCGGAGECDDLGACLTNCTQGMYGVLCDQPCPNCGLSCTQDGAECDSCIATFYGRLTNLCTSLCSTNCTNSNCHDDSAACIDGCINGRYSKATQCDQVCPLECSAPGDCSDDGSTCLSGCIAKRRDADCQGYCNNCQNWCDQYTQECDSCIAGQTGRLTNLCGTSCPTNCLGPNNDCDQDSAECTLGCDPGFYSTSTGCDQTCPANCGGTFNECNNVGQCLYTCDDSFFSMSTGCDQNCASECGGNKTCNDLGDTCLEGCVDGRRGQNCQLTCPHCAVSCDQYTMECNACDPGWYNRDTNLCNTPCPANCLNNVCDELSGECTDGCNPGYMDKATGCVTSCPAECFGNACDNAGVCTLGCNTGFFQKATGCSETCPEECAGFNNPCDDLGFCSGCDNGHNGADCQGVCDNCVISCSQYGTDCNSCKPGFYNRLTNLCLTPCPDNCVGNECHEDFGSCTLGCEDGWYNTVGGCVDPCPLECGGPGDCNDAGTYCESGCDAKKYGDTCQDSCDGCQTDCLQDGSSCDACPSGYYGVDTTLCTTPCPTNCIGNVCDEVDGACTMGCVPGWYNAAGGCVDKCPATCSGIDDNCDDLGRCESGCDDGWYSKATGCDLECHSECGDPKDCSDDGAICLSGCVDGKRGDDCQESCDNCANFCDQYNQECDSCVSTFFGRLTDLCTLPCPGNCISGLCHEDSGACSIGCVPGWFNKGSGCFNKCPDNCAGPNNDCNDLGQCTLGCDVGFYSMLSGCNLICDEECGGFGNPCWDNGLCEEGCDNGYRGEKCQSQCDNCALYCSQYGNDCNACKPGWWEKDTNLCNTPCPSNCIGLACDEDTGACTVGCVDGWYDMASGCSKKCPSSCGGDGTCDDSGDCNQGCDNHYYGTNCLSMCPNCEVSCAQSGLSCDSPEGCISGYYGQNTNLCQTPCPMNCVGNQCDDINGACTLGCKPGYYGKGTRCISGCDARCAGADNECFDDGTCSVGCDVPYYDVSSGCSLLCPPNCALDGSCNDEGDCHQGCNVGYWGDDCRRTCPQHCVDTCDQVTGDCDSGCDDTYWGPKCTSECSYCTKCDQLFGKTCDDCVFGQWDLEDGCSQTCSDDCETPGECAPEDGSCPCAVGFYGPDCTTACPDGCEDNTKCLKLSGKCNTCDNKKWGDWCTKTCPKCQSCSKWDGNDCPSCEPGNWGLTVGCQNACSSTCDPADQCHDDTGACLTGCQTGYYDVSNGCDKECSEHCNPSRVCNLDGTCDVCELNYYGTECRYSCHLNCDAGFGCDKTTAKCNQCPNGRWGDQCGSICVGGSFHCRDYCDQDTGEKCNENAGAGEERCEDGYYDWENQCRLSCPENCDGNCEMSTGVCSACVSGFYDDTCSSLCLENCEHCDFSTGVCDLCKDHFFLTIGTAECLGCQDMRDCELCDDDLGCERCSTGLYGPTCEGDCLTVTENCIHCEHDGSECTICMGGFELSGSICIEAVVDDDNDDNDDDDDDDDDSGGGDQKNNAGAVAGGVIGSLLGVVVLIIIIVVAVVVVYYVVTKVRKAGDDDLNDGDVEMDVLVEKTPDEVLKKDDKKKKKKKDTELVELEEELVLIE